MRSIDLDSLEIFRTVAMEGGVIRAAQQAEPRAVERHDAHQAAGAAPRPRAVPQAGPRPGAVARGRTAAVVCAAAVPPGRRGGERAAHGRARWACCASARSRARPAAGSRRSSRATTASIRASWSSWSPAPPARLLQRVAQFELEAAFVSEPFTPGGLSQHEGLRRGAGADHRRAACAPVRRAADLAGMTLMAFATGCSYRKRLEDWLGASALLPARTLELASYQAMIACVAAGTGFAVVPRSLLVSLKAAQRRAAARAAGPRAAQSHAPGLERHAVDGAGSACRNCFPGRLRTEGHRPLRRREAGRPGYVNAGHWRAHCAAADLRAR